MDYKEKYKQALAKAKEQYNYPCMRSCMGILEEIFPELKGSEDEKVRKALLELVHDTTGDELWIDYNVHKEEALDWLERQVEQNFEMKTAAESLGISSDEYNKIVDECLFGEQKLTEFERGLFDMLTDISNPCTADCVKSHSEKLLSIARKMIALEQKPEENKGNIGGISSNWSEEDEENFCSVYLDVKSARQNTVNSLSGDLKEQEEKRMDEVISWLRSLKGRVLPKQEWSEEDEQHIDSLLKRLDALCRNKFERTRFAISEDRDWLKSLRPQNRWKPSDEQMEALDWQVENTSVGSWQYKATKELMVDLKKLKEGKV